jgi:hypothetical protein
MLMMIIYQMEAYMLIKQSTWSCLKIRMQDSHNIKIDNSSFERVEQFKYLGTTLTNQNSIQEEIKRRLKSGNACYHSVQSLLSSSLLSNACYHSVQSLLSSSLLSKNLKIKIYGTLILPVVLYGRETWSLTVREELRLRVFENRVLRRIFGPEEGRGNGGMEKIT